MEDKILWNKLRSGDQKALEMIYQRYFDDLYRYGRSYTQDLNALEDCIQDLFVDLWNRKERLSETDAIKPYLFVSLKRRIFKTTKKNRNTTQVEMADMQFVAELAIDQIIINNELMVEQSESLKEAYGKLSDRQKEILYLKYYSDMSYEEISEIMDLNYQSARNLVSRAIQKLSKQMFLIFLMIFIGIK